MPAKATHDGLRIEPRHDLTALEVDAIETELYAYNRQATGRGDGDGVGFVVRDDEGRMIAAAAGYTWAGIAELKQLWIDAAYRGQGLGRVLLDAFVGEAGHRGVRRIWVASYDFQAPGFYERAGFHRVAEFDGWPEGHVNVILCRNLPSAD